MMTIAESTRTDASAVRASGNENVAMPTADWQTIVLAGQFPEGCTSESTALNDRLRFDSPRALVREPKYIETWSMDVGWHKRGTQVVQQDSENRKRASYPRRAIARESLAPKPERASAKQAAGRRKTDVAPRRSRESLRTRDEQFMQSLSEVAHDIRSPIAVAQQVIDTVLAQAQSSGSMNKSEIELMDIAAMRLQQASKISESILVNRCLERSKTLNIRKRFYPAQWRASVAPLLESVAARRRVNIVWEDWDRSMPRLYLDPNLLNRAVLNLTSHAVDASPFGSEVEISLKMDTLSSNELRLRIQHVGRPISEAILKRLNSMDQWSVASTDQRSEELAFRTARALIHGMGAELKAANMHDGVCYEVIMPVDAPQSLVRSWLVQNSVSPTALDTGSTSEIELNVVRATSVDNNFVDMQLQQNAGGNDFVYRVGEDKWVWLSINPTGSHHGSENLRRSVTQIEGVFRSDEYETGCMAQTVYRIRGYRVCQMRPMKGSFVQLTEAASLLAGQITKLTGQLVPAVDMLTGMTGDIHFRRATKKRKRLRRDHAQSSFAPKLSTIVRNNAASPTEAMSAGSDDTATIATRSLPATATELKALSEVSQLWRADQSALSRSHASLTRSQSQ